MNNARRRNSTKWLGRAPEIDTSPPSAEFDDPAFKRSAELDKEFAESNSLGDWFVPVSRLFLAVEGLLSEMQRKVYLCLVSHMDYKTRHVRYSHNKVAVELGITRLTVIRATEWLVSAGLIEVEKESDFVHATTYEIVMPSKDDAAFAVAAVKANIRKINPRPYLRPVKARKRKEMEDDA